MTAVVAILPLISNEAAPLFLTVVSTMGVPVIVGNSTPAVTDCHSNPV